MGNLLIVSIVLHEQRKITVKFGHICSIGKVIERLSNNIVLQYMRSLKFFFQYISCRLPIRLILECVECIYLESVACIILVLTGYHPNPHLLSTDIICSVKQLCCILLLYRLKVCVHWTHFPNIFPTFFQHLLLQDHVGKMLGKCC